MGGVCAFWGLHRRHRSKMVTLVPLARTSVVALVVVCAGGARQALYHTPSPRTIAPIAGLDSDPSVSLIGTIDRVPERSDSTTRITVAVDSLGTVASRRSVTGRVRVTLRPSPWSSLSTSFPRLYEGDRIQLRGTLHTPPSKRNPGGFDYAAYLSRRGICCTMYVGDPDAISVRRRATSATALLVNTRRHIRTQIGRYVPSEAGRAFLHALLLGNRSQISDAQQEWFTRTGLMHLLAVSGLHVFLVGMVLYTLLQPLLTRLRLSWTTVEVGRALLTMALLGSYMVLTGAPPSVVRAVVMSALLIGGVVLQRSTHPLNTLGVAALVLLGARPTALFDAGFQLSMTAVAGIVTLQPRIEEWLPTSWTQPTAMNWLTSTVTVSVAATLGTAPVLLFHFGWVSGVGLVLNVPAIPCTGLALSAGIVLVFVGDLWSVAGAAFGSGADFFVQGLLLLAREGADGLGWFGVQLAEPSFWTMGTLGAVIFAVAQWPRPRHRWRGLICALLLMTGGVWSDAIGRSARPTLDVVFFDVGQGDAVLLTTPDEHHVLVDTGPRSLTGSPAVSFSVLPYLRERGIHHLDAVVVTHPDADHLGGLPAVLKEVAVDRVLHSGQRADTELFRRSRRLLRQKNVSVNAVERGDSLMLGDAVRGQVLGPPTDPSRRGIQSENDQSVVLQVAYGGTTILLPGDVEAAAERDLVRVYDTKLQSQIVNVPHHGSSTSSTLTFVEAVVEKHKTKAVISAGRSDRFEMPDSSVVSRWRSEGAKVFRTDRDGAHWFRSDGSRVWPVQWR